MPAQHVTVLTPTYNRSEYLEKLYTSLLQQSNKNFIWLIIDDGSNDNTENVVKGWQEEASITIEYRRKENGGKHRALNFAYALINTPLTFIVDSDDYLTRDAIEIIEDKYRIYGQEADLCGFSFLRAKEDGSYLSSSGVKEDGLKENFSQCRINRHITGDMAEVWFTHCLREYPFPEFEGEKFLGEDIIWLQMSVRYKIRFFNDVIYISDYMPQGLTSKRRQHNIRSPRGCIARAEVYLSSDIKTRYKIKPMLQYFIYGRFSGAGFIRQLKRVWTKHKFLSLICLIPSMLLYESFVMNNDK